MEKVSAKPYKERRAWMSHADTGYRKTSKLESILNEPKLEQGERKENSAGVCKRNYDRPIFVEIAFYKNITDITHFQQNCR